MKDFNIQVCMTGCHLTIQIPGGTPDIYQVLFNTITEEYSEIIPYTNSFESEMEEDGIYRYCIIQAPEAVLQDGKLHINGKILTNIQLAQSIVDEDGLVLGNYIDNSFSDEIFCICKLKKCLLDLQLKVFKDLVKNCGSSKCKNGDELKAQRDFLFLAVWLMEHLIDAGKSELVRDIFERLQSCGSICGNLLKSNKDCGCNG